MKLVYCAFLALLVGAQADHLQEGDSRSGPGEDCEINGDCAEDFRCYSIEGNQICFPFDGDACSEDSGCPGSDVCFENDCVRTKDPGECRSNGDCRGSLICLNSITSSVFKCRPPGDERDYCLADNDCFGTLICNSSDKCEDPDAKTTPPPAPTTTPLPKPTTTPLPKPTTTPPPKPTTTPPPTPKTTSPPTPKECSSDDDCADGLVCDEDTQSCKNKPTSLAIVGAGIGGAVVLLSSCIGLFCWKRRKPSEPQTTTNLSNTEVPVHTDRAPERSGNDASPMAQGGTAGENSSSTGNTVPVPFLWPGAGYASPIHHTNPPQVQRSPGPGSSNSSGAANRAATPQGSTWSASTGNNEQFGPPSQASSGSARPVFVENVNAIRVPASADVEAGYSSTQIEPKSPEPEGNNGRPVFEEYVAPNADGRSPQKPFPRDRSEYHMLDS